MNFLRKYKTILIVLAIAIVGFAAYTFLFGGDDEDLLTTTEVSNDAASQEVLSFLGTLRNTDFDLSVLDSAAFNSLRDFSVELVPEPVGRPNPFAPIGVDIISGDTQ